MPENGPKTPGLESRAMPDPWTRRLILVGAGLVASGIRLVALGFISALIGVWAQPRDGRAMDGRSATMLFRIVAGIAALGRVWFAASARAS